MVSFFLHGEQHPAAVRQALFVLESSSQIGVDERVGEGSVGNSFPRYSSGGFCDPIASIHCAVARRIRFVSMSLFFITTSVPIILIIISGGGGVDVVVTMVVVVVLVVVGGGVGVQFAC